MSSSDHEKLVRFSIAEIPIIRTFIEKLNIASIFTEYIPRKKNEALSVADSLILIIYNITIGRDPLYMLKEWVLKIAQHAHNIHFDNSFLINDDRFARALDKLYQADRASILTSLVIHMIKSFKINTDQIHNDSTTVKACGVIPGTTDTGFTLAHGKSKDHRPDLKQLLYCLSISADGGVPIHYKTYPGNRTDDTTHIETWKMLAKIVNRTDFLYVADCKVCTHHQLSTIVRQGGRVITIIPETWKEVNDFKKQQKKSSEKKIFLWQRPIPNNRKETEQFFLFQGDYFSYKNGYRIHWIFSTEKQKNDKARREKILGIVDKKLERLLPRLNKYHLKTKKEIQDKVNQIFAHYKAGDMIKISLKEKKTIIRKQIGKGRPGLNTKYKKSISTKYILYWEYNEEIIHQMERIDGIFPILSTDTTITAEHALKAYKYQPHLEKRFTQFKSIHEAAPLLFKKIRRIESVMFLFFISLMIQALIERRIRKKMKEKKLKFLSIYPEYRKSPHPTTSQIFRLFEDISSYQLQNEGEITREFYDDLSSVHKQILELLEISENEYWH